MEQKKTPKARLLWLIPLALATVFILARHQKREIPYQNIQGLIFGTYYSITYQHDDDLKAEVDEELRRFDASLSPFNDTSVISKVNRNEKVELDSMFTKVFVRSQEISEETGGAFDITVGPLVNAWGFGFKHERFPDSLTIDSLLQLTGYRKIALKDGQVVKDDPRIMINCSAIAKGYASDVIGYYLTKKGIANYMVDIGGEIVLKGANPQGAAWRIGISKPEDDSLAVEKKLQNRLQLTDAGIATSGNYYNYYYKDGVKYAHTIDPRTGYPVQHEILSATVIAPNCITADALATAFMVFGFDKTVEYLNAHPSIGAYLIYNSKENTVKTYATPNVARYVADF